MSILKVDKIEPLTSDCIELSCFVLNGEVFAGGGASVNGWAATGSFVHLTTLTDFVGIGTTSPGYKLEVAGNIRAASGSNSLMFDVDGTNAGNAGLWANGSHLVLGSVSHRDLTVFLEDKETIQFSYADAPNKRVSYTSHGGTGDHVFNGKVGVGTTNPTEQFDVDGNIRSASGSNSLTLDVNGTNSGNAGLWSDGSHLVLGSKTTNDLNIFLNDAETLQITRATSPVNRVSYLSHGGTGAHSFVGNVGIGTTSPISELDVAGKIAITAESATPAIPSDGQGYLYSKSDGKIYWRSFDVAEVDLTAAGGGSSGGWTESGADVYVTDTADDVGIGTTSPGYKLEVAGDAKISGPFTTTKRRTVGITDVDVNTTLDENSNAIVIADAAGASITITLPILADGATAPADYEGWRFDIKCLPLPGAGRTVTIGRSVAGSAGVAGCFIDGTSADTVVSSGQTSLTLVLGRVAIDGSNLITRADWYIL